MRRVLVSALLAAALVSPQVLHAQRIKLPMSVKELERAARQDPHDAAAHYNLALGYWSQKKYDRAEAELREATSLEPRFAIAHLARAMLPFARRGNLWNESLEDRVPLDWRDQVAESDRLYRTAFLMDPLLDLRILGAVTPKRSVLWDVIPELSRMYNEWMRGFDDFREGDYEAAYMRLNRLARDATIGRQDVATMPRGLLWYRGLSAAHIERYDDAIRDLSELLARAEEGEDASQLTYLPVEANTYRYVLASVLHRAGRLDRAAELYRAVLMQDAGMYLAHVALADIMEEAGDLQGALAERQRAAAANPEDFTTGFETAITLLKLGRNGEAEEELRRVTDAEPRYARAWQILGILQQATGRPDEARTSLQRFLEVAPSRFGGQIEDARARLAQIGG